MNLDDLERAGIALATGLRETIRVEFTSIWLPIQLGMILIAAFLAAAIGALVRRKFDLVEATMAWPAYLRVVVRGIVANLGLLAFVGILTIARAGIRAGIEHPRTYLIGVALDLATAWIVI